MFKGPPKMGKVLRPADSSPRQGRDHVEKSSLESSGAPVAEGAAYLKGRL